MGDDLSEKPTPKNRGGRPKKYPGEGRRPTLSLRVRGGLYEKLQAASEVAERTISEEMERRLERSFEEQDLFLAYFGKPETLKLAHAIAMLARTVEARTGLDWTKDAQTKADLSGAISRFFDLYFYEQGEENSVSSVPLKMLGDLAHGLPAAECVAAALGLKSRKREEMDAFLATQEGRAALERFMAGKSQSDASAPKKD